MFHIKYIFIFIIWFIFANAWHYVDHHFILPPDVFFEASLNSPDGTRDIGRYVDIYPGFLTGSPVITRLILRDARSKKEANIFNADGDSGCVSVRWEGSDQVVISVCEEQRHRVGERMVGDVRLRIELRTAP